MVVFVLSIGIAFGFVFGSGIVTLTLLIHAMKNDYTDKIT